MSMIMDGIASFISNAIKTNPNKYAPLETVNDINLQRYTGKWYEIATIPQFYEKDTHCTTAEYALQKDGSISVLNSAYTTSTPEKLKTIKGKAFPDINEPGKLEVQFWWPFRGLYWVIALDKENYTYSVVGHPSRQYLWILSRTPVMNENLYEQLVDGARQKGFPIDQLRRTDQSCNTQMAEEAWLKPGFIPAPLAPVD